MAVGLGPFIPLAQLALDGSWDSADARMFAYGGVVGMQSNWMYLTEKWQAILDNVGIESFHMVEAMNFRGQFSRLGREWGAERIERRDRLLDELITCAERSNFSAFGLGADIRLLGDQVKAAKKKEMFQAVVRDSIQNLDPSYRLAILCDREQDAALLFLGWLENLFLREPKQRTRVWAFCFIDDRYVAAAQLADIWVYLLREDSERRSFTPDVPPNPLFARLAARARRGRPRHG